jgi:putative transposase
MDLLLDHMDRVRQSMHVFLLGYVLMPDHCHLLLLTQSESISRVMHQWKFKTGFAVQQYRHHSGSFWQPRYFDFICRRLRDISDKLAYIHQNPVIGKFVDNPEDWKWSSAASYLRKGQSPIVPDILELNGDPDALLW